MYDTVVIGAGIAGCSAARELTRYALSVCVIEAKSDIAEGTTKANSAIVHAGYDAKPGSKKAYYNVKGNAMFPQLSEELDFEFRAIGSLVLRFKGDDPNGLEDLMQRGVDNGVPQMRIVGRAELEQIEPHIGDDVTDALLAETGGICCPYGMTEAYAENAASNGAQFIFNSPVRNIRFEDEAFTICTPNGSFRTRSIVNAAGLYADDISRMMGGMEMLLHPRKGEYCLFDRDVGGHVRHVVFQLPGPLGKGVLVTPTADDNMIIGPSAEDIDDKQDLSTSAHGLHDILKSAARSIKDLPLRSVINSFAGNRARPESDDFIIGPDDNVAGLYHIAGIESPGLTASPAIAVDVARDVAAHLGADMREDFNPKRKRIPRFLHMTDQEREQAIEQVKAYANIVCRCESVTEAEVVASIRRVPGARTLDGVKRRTRAGMGRCQAGFCMTRVMQILERELGLAPEEVTKRGGESYILTGRIKEDEPCVK